MKAFCDQGNGDMYEDAFDIIVRKGRDKIENAYDRLKNS